MTSARCVCRILIFLLVVSGISAAQTEPLTLKRAVQLAVTHSTAMAQATADEQRAFASYREARNQYVPQVVVGSGLGKSWGFPLSLENAAPSIFNVNSQSAVINPALREFVRAARDESGAAALQSKDQRQQVMQDVVISYLELAKWEGMLPELTKTYNDAQKALELIHQRVEAGVDSQAEGQKSQLIAARAHLRALQGQGAVDVLRDQIARLTGLPSNSIVTVPDSIPTLPEITKEEDLTTKATESSFALQAAQFKARALAFRAKGEHRSLWPSLDFAAQYAVLSKYNNYDQFFKTFERNNASLGGVIRFPFLNFSQRAHAQAADAEALRANKEVENAKNQVSQEVLKLQRSVEQLKAAQEVAELEYKLAQSNVNSVDIRMNSGTANIHDQADAQTDLSEKFNSLEDAKFQLLRARIALLRATGELEAWAQK
jgi:outer membrane protein TolC